MAEQSTHHSTDQPSGFDINEETTTPFGTPIFQNETSQILRYKDLPGHQMETALGIMGMLCNGGVLIVFAFSKDILKRNFFNLLIINQVRSSFTSVVDFFFFISDIISWFYFSTMMVLFSECSRFLQHFYFTSYFTNCYWSHKNIQQWVVCRSGV